MGGGSGIFGVMMERDLPGTGRIMIRPGAHGESRDGKCT